MTACSFPPLRPPIFDVAREVAEETGLPVEAILGRSRTRRCVQARWMVIRRLHDVGWSAASIGRTMGLDHSSVLHALAKTPAPAGTSSMDWRHALLTPRLYFADVDEAAAWARCSALYPALLREAVSIRPASAPSRDGVVLYEIAVKR